LDLRYVVPRYAPTCLEPVVLIGQGGAVTAWRLDRYQCLACGSLWTHDSTVPAWYRGIESRVLGSAAA
jgi:hypothetical protein